MDVLLIALSVASFIMHFTMDSWGVNSTPLVMSLALYSGEWMVLEMKLEIVRIVTFNSREMGGPYHGAT